MGNWSEFCDDILQLIVDQLSAIKDVVHFGAVCRQWQSVFIKNWHLCTASPWLMLAEKDDSGNREFYSVSADRVYHLNLPEAHGKECWSSCGWLITVGLDLEMHLLNPFSRDQIRLPQPAHVDHYLMEIDPEDLENVHRNFMDKVILSSRPSFPAKTTPFEEAEECVIMVITSQDQNLAFMRLGDEVWTLVKSDSDVGFFDVIHRNGKFYAIDNLGKLFTVDICSPHPKTIEFADPPKGKTIHKIFYSVESVRKLFMVALAQDASDESRTIANLISGVDHSDVYQFSFDNREWTQVKSSRDNRALSVDGNCSYDVLADDRGVCLLEIEAANYLYIRPDIVSRIHRPVWILHCM